MEVYIADKSRTSHRTRNTSQPNSDASQASTHASLLKAKTSSTESYPSNQEVLHPEGEMTSSCSNLQCYASAEPLLEIHERYAAHESLASGGPFAASTAASNKKAIQQRQSHEILRKILFGKGLFSQSTAHLSALCIFGC